MRSRAELVRPSAAPAAANHGSAEDAPNVPAVPTRPSTAKSAGAGQPNDS